MKPRLIRTLEAAPLLVIVAICIGAVSVAFASPAPFAATEVMVFQPARPAGAMHEGRCWTESIAVSRPGAWRCMEDNSISDPCFQSPGHADEVICGANPADGGAGFAMKLTEPLPKTDGGQAQSAPWIIELADGRICQAATGTMAIIGQQAVRYPCGPPAGAVRSDSAPEVGVLDNLKPGKIWIAEEVWFTIRNDGGNGVPFRLVKRKPVAVRRIWE